MTDPCLCRIYGILLKLNNILLIIGLFLWGVVIEGVVHDTYRILVVHTTNISYTGVMFERCLYFNLNALTRAVNRLWDQAFSEFGLSPAHAYLVRLVLAKPGLSSKQISRELKLEKSTVARFVEAVDKKGYIQRKKNIHEDAREIGIYPSDKARRIAGKLEQKGDELYQKMIAGFGKQELASFVKALREREQKLK